MDSSTPIESSATLKCIKEENLAGSETTGSLKVLDQFGDKKLELFVKVSFSDSLIAFRSCSSSTFPNTRISRTSNCPKGRQDIPSSRNNLLSSNADKYMFFVLSFLEARYSLRSQRFCKSDSLRRFEQRSKRFWRTLSVFLTNL